MILLEFSVGSDVGYIERKNSRVNPMFLAWATGSYRDAIHELGKKWRWSRCLFWFAGSRNSVSDRGSLRSLIYKCKFEVVVRRWVESVGWRRYRFRNHRQSKLLNQRWSPIAVVRKLLGTKDQFHRRQFSHRFGVGGLVSGRFRHITSAVPLVIVTWAPPQIEVLDPGRGSPLTGGDSGRAVDEIWLGHGQHGAVCGSEATA